MNNGAHLASATVPWHWLFFCPAPKFCTHFGHSVTKSLKSPKWHWLISVQMGALAWTHALGPPGPNELHLHSVCTVHTVARAPKNLQNWSIIAVFSYCYSHTATGMLPAWSQKVRLCRIKAIIDVLLLNCFFAESACFHDCNCQFYFD